MQQKGMANDARSGRYGARYVRVMLGCFLGGVLCVGGFARDLPDQAPLAGILKGSAAYCERLKARVFHFFCEEKVSEEIEKALQYPNSRTGMKNFFEKVDRRDSSSPGTVGMGRKMDRVYGEMDRNRQAEAYRSFRQTDKQSCLCDYQIIQDHSGLREQRIPLEVNGKKVPRGTPLPATVLYSYGNAMVPVMLFAAEVQPSCRYTLLGQEKAGGRRCFVVKVVRRGPAGDAELAKAWIDRTDFSIVRCEVFPPAIDGYDALLKLDRVQMSNLNISDVHEYDQLHEGFRYPSRTEITVSYNNEPRNVAQSAPNSKPRMGGIIYTRARTVITHRKYRFFKTGVGQPVFLNLGED